MLEPYERYMTVKGVRDNLKYWEQREFQNYKGKDLEHKDLWLVVAQLLRHVRLWVTHVKSHTGAQDFHSKGNAMVDLIAQARAVRVG